MLTRLISFKWSKQLVASPSHFPGSQARAETNLRPRQRACNQPYHGYMVEAAPHTTSPLQRLQIVQVSQAELNYMWIYLTSVGSEQCPSGVNESETSQYSKLFTVSYRKWTVYDISVNAASFSFICCFGNDRSRRDVVFRNLTVSHTHFLMLRSRHSRLTVNTRALCHFRHF